MMPWASVFLVAAGAITEARLQRICEQDLNHEAILEAYHLYGCRYYSGSSGL